MVIVTPFEVAVTGLLHAFEDVTTQETTSLFAKVALLNVEAFAPETFVPLILH
jgi:hypothetical protein